MQFMFLLVARAVDFNDVSAMQLQTLLHSGRESPSPYIGVFVSSAGVQEEDMLSVLRVESEAQIYRYLHEVGIINVNIAPVGSAFSLEEFQTPSASVIEAAARELKTTLDSLNIWSIPSIVDVVSFTMRLDNAQKIATCRQFAETNFVLMHLDTLKKRVKSPYDVGYKNMQRTQREEVHAVYQQILQEYMPADGTRWPFDFHGAGFNFEKPALTQPRQIPLTLTVPLDQASAISILNFVVNDKHGGKIDKVHLIDLWNQLERKYLKQIAEYSHFLGIPNYPTQDDLSLVKRVQKYRRHALELYDQFRLPFPSPADPLFHIYMHDPEGRASLRREGKPFATMSEAMVFAKHVFSSFERVPKFYYSGVLRSVVLFDRGDDPLKVPFATYDAVLHKSSQIYDFKSRLMLRSKLLFANPGYTWRINQCLKEAERYFGFDTTGTDQRDVERLSEVADKLLDFMGNREEGGSKLRNEIAKLSYWDEKFLVSLRDGGRDEKDMVVFEFALDSQEAVATNVGGEAAVLYGQLADPTKRAMLASDCRDNAVTRLKATLALNALASRHLAIGEIQSDMEERLAIAREMRVLEIRTHSDPGRYAVVLVDAQTASFDLFDEANTFVRRKIEEGHRVSFLLFTGHGSYLQRVHVRQQAITRTGNRYDQPVIVVIYGTDATEDVIFPQIQGLLAKADLDFDGQRRIGPRDVGVPVMMHAGCMRTL